MAARCQAPFALFYGAQLDVQLAQHAPFFRAGGAKLLAGDLASGLAGQPALIVDIDRLGDLEVNAQGVGQSQIGGMAER